MTVDPIFFDRAREAVLSSAERLLDYDEGQAWNESQCNSVARTLIDRASGIAILEGWIQGGRHRWFDAKAFREWLEAIPMSLDQETRSDNPEEV